MTTINNQGTVSPGAEVRNLLGLPSDWKKVDYWINGKDVPHPSRSEAPSPDLKWPKIPALRDYRSVPEDSFWLNFPSRKLPLAPATTVNKPALRNLMNQAKMALTTHQYRRGLRCLGDLSRGASACQKSELPPVTVRNASSAFENGRMLTDKIATWIDTGFVAGPFRTAPVPGFRANPLMAVKRKGTVRPIINMSAPKGASFNENVIENQLEKVRMATAQSFGYAIRKCNKNARMSKFDKKDAYKLIPARKEDWNKQGFSWLGMNFVELQQIFGGVPSVSNFDRLGNTILTITLSQCRIPRHLVFRTLDDVPVVAPGNTNWCEEFSTVYQKVCRQTNIKLAVDCPNKDKAFTNQTEGTVLGIRFNTVKMEWSLSKDKADELICKILWAVSSDGYSLKEAQQLLGSLNDLSQMCPFVKPYRALANNFLSSFKGNEQLLQKFGDQAKADLMVCARVAETARAGIPIPRQPAAPPLYSLTCYSDAAGSKFAMINGQRVSNNEPGDRGVASVVLNGKGEVIGWARVFWPKFFLEQAKDDKGAYYGSKTTTLEAIGLIIPMLISPGTMAGRHLTFKVDNIAVVFGWENKVVKNDTTATILIRTLHLLSAYLGVFVHVRHEPRCSSKFSILADHLSRQSTTKQEDLAILGHVPESTVEGALVDWLRNPVIDWELPNKMLKELINHVSYLNILLRRNKYLHYPPPQKTKKTPP
jgi:hypothetical protein